MSELQQRRFYRRKCYMCDVADRAENRPTTYSCQGKVLKEKINRQKKKAPTLCLDWVYKTESIQ